VNAIAPGYFATPTNEYLVNDATVQAYVAQRNPAQTLGPAGRDRRRRRVPASDEASYVNGHVLVSTAVTRLFSSRTSSRHTPSMRG